jgi:spermidine synthase
VSRAALLAPLLVGCGRDRAVDLPAAVTERATERAVEIARRYGVEPLPLEGIDLDTPFSKVRLQDAGLQRSLFFVRDDGTPMLQTRVNLALPHQLLVPYTQLMFVSYFFQPEPARVLIVGLGGGAMVRYLERRDPRLEILAVDIDPEIVSIADRYFGTRPSERVRLLVADGYEVIRNGADTYDVIYMDAFLRPSDETDQSGNPLRLKETSFYAALRARLSPGGVVVFNLNPQPERDSDVAELRQAFQQLYVFHSGGDLNWVAVATQEATPRSAVELAELAPSLGPRFEGDLSFSELIEMLQPPA